MNGPLAKRRRERRDECVRSIIQLEIDLYGRVLSGSIQEACDHEPETWVRMFAKPTPEGRRGEWYTACSRCRLEFKR